jgi:hypothetical protein
VDYVPARLGVLKKLPQKCWSAISTSAVLSLSMYLVFFALTTVGGYTRRDLNLAALKNPFQARAESISERL